jgi:hypothetical protein
MPQFAQKLIGMEPVGQFIRAAPDVDVQLKLEAVTFSGTPFPFTLNVSVTLSSPPRYRSVEWSGCDVDVFLMVSVYVTLEPNATEVADSVFVIERLIGGFLQVESIVTLVASAAVWVAVRSLRLGANETL